jgi:hypothetical protein
VLNENVWNSLDTCSEKKQETPDPCCKIDHKAGYEIDRRSDEFGVDFDHANPFMNWKPSHKLD